MTINTPKGFEKAMDSIARVIPQSQSLPSIEYWVPPKQPKVAKSMAGLKFYLASPFFNDKEIKRVELLEKVLRARDITVFSPRENQLPEYEFGGFEWRTNVFRNDIHHIMWADAVIAIVDDNYDDTGTAWEIGYAYAMGKPIYIYNPTGNIINLMITDSTHGYFESVTEIIDYDFHEAPIKPYTGEVK